MADHTDAHGSDAGRETPSQGLFIGYLALGLLILAVLVAAFGIFAGASQGFQ